jgi:hypothetical protein
VRAESQKALAEAEKARAEGSEIRERVRNVDARVANAPEVERALAVFDSRTEGFGPAFEIEQWDGATGTVSLESTQHADDTLTVHRTNRDGSFVVWLTSYAYQGGLTVIPPDPGGPVRKLPFNAKFERLAESGRCAGA